MRKLFLLSAICLSLISVKLQAQENKLGYFNSLAIGANIGSTGWGVDIATPIGQYLALRAGVTIMPNYSYSDEVDVSIETADPSMDRRHCVINVRRNKQGQLIYTLRDNQSVTGTFLMNEILGDKDRVRIEEGAIITLGATTLILRVAED